MTHLIGCFGSVLYHKPGNVRCDACPHFSECATAVVNNKAKMKRWAKDLQADKEVSEATKRAVRSVIAPTPTRTRTAAVTAATEIKEPNALNKKPREYVTAWSKRGIKFDGYKDGSNPFATCGNKFAVVAMDYLIANNTVTREGMIDEFMDKLKWLPGTAASHANIVFEAFNHLEIIHVSGSGMSAVATLR